MSETRGPSSTRNIDLDVHRRLHWSPVNRLSLIELITRAKATSPCRFVLPARFRESDFGSSDLCWHPAEGDPVVRPVDKRASTGCRVSGLLTNVVQAIAKGVEDGLSAYSLAWRLICRQLPALCVKGEIYSAVGTSSEGNNGTRN